MFTDLCNKEEQADMDSADGQFSPSNSSDLSDSEDNDGRGGGVSPPDGECEE